MFTGLIEEVGKVKNITYLKDEYEDKGVKWTHNILGPWIVLCFSWLIKLIIF